VIFAVLVEFIRNWEGGRPHETTDLQVVKISNTVIIVKELDFRAGLIADSAAKFSDVRNIEMLSLSHTMRYDMIT